MELVLDRLGFDVVANFIATLNRSEFIVSFARMGDGRQSYNFQVPWNRKRNS